MRCSLSAPIPRPVFRKFRAARMSAFGDRPPFMDDRRRPRVDLQRANCEHAFDARD